MHPFSPVNYAISRVKVERKLSQKVKESKERRQLEKYGRINERE